MSLSSRVFSVLALSVIACGGESRHAEAPPQTIPPAEEPSATTTPGVAASTTEAATATTPASATGATPSEATTTPKAEALSDGEIAFILDGANRSEVDQGKIALKRGKDPQVKKFADMMVNEHGVARKQLKWLLKEIDVINDESPLSIQLSKDAWKDTAMLHETASSDFDRTYIDTQVDAHAKLLDTIDTQLLPNAKNERLQAELTKTRGVVEGHLKTARELQQALATGTAGTPSTPKTQGTTNPKK